MSENTHVSQPTPAQMIVARHRGDIGTLRDALVSSIPHHRVLAVSGLSKLDALTVTEIETASRDAARTVRHRLAQIGARDVHIEIRVLLDLLTDTEFAVAETAAWALGERFEGCTGNDLDPVAFDALCRNAADHPHQMVRESCVAALGAIGDPRGLPAILSGCRDKPAVRRRAVLALAPFDGDDVDAALKAALSDRDWQVRQAAEDLLGIAGSGTDDVTDSDSATGVVYP